MRFLLAASAVAILLTAASPGAAMAVDARKPTRAPLGTELALGKLALPLGEALRRIDNLACHTSE